MSGVIQEAWASYEAAVIPCNAHKTQRVECKRAFYAGATSLLAGMMVSLDPGSDPTPADLARMDGIQAELDAFEEDVAGGRS